MRLFPRRASGAAALAASALMLAPAVGLGSDSPPTRDRLGGARSDAIDVCGSIPSGVQCGPGNGRKTSGGGAKVSHDGNGLYRAQFDLPMGGNVPSGAINRSRIAAYRFARASTAGRIPSHSGRSPPTASSTSTSIGWITKLL